MSDEAEKRPEPAKVFPFVPVARAPLTRFVSSFEWARAVALNSGRMMMRGAYWEAASFDIATKRNLGVRMFMEDPDAEWLLMVDDDMDFSACPTALVKLLDAAEKVNADIIGAFYVMRSPPCLPCVQEKVGFLTPLPRLVTAIAKEEVMQVTGHVGTGCMFIRRRVFDVMPKPYFQGKTTDRCGACRKTDEAPPMADCGRCGGDGKNPTGVWHEMSEDGWFCRRAVDHGLSVFCHMGVQLGHVGEYVYDIEDSMRFQQPEVHSKLILANIARQKAAAAELAVPDSVREELAGAKRDDSPSLVVAHR